MRSGAPRAGFLPGMATLAAALCTLGRSYRRFEWRTGEDERHTARTPDGWTLALYRYRARGAARLREVRLSLLLLAAAHDPQPPPDSVQAAYDAIGSPNKTFVQVGITTGFSVDFGHDDLLAGVATGDADIWPDHLGCLPTGFVMRFTVQ